MSINNQESLQLFEDQPIRTAWDEEREAWYTALWIPKRSGYCGDNHTA